jgi:amino-acid N-acetyltransferase
MYTPNKASQFVAWFREASPYIHAHRGRTFVISFSGESVESQNFPYLIYDIALLSSLGIRLVLVHGVRHQVEKGLSAQGLSARYIHGMQITDEITLECVKQACGAVVIDIESYLSMGLANSPTSSVGIRTIRTVSGNFITAKPVGIRDGVDFCYTGEVRSVDATAITHHLDQGNIVLISPIGYSPTGEIFNIANEEIATSVAISLRAAKWVCLTDNNNGLLDEKGELIRQLSLIEAQHWLAKQEDVDKTRQLANAVRACQYGVPRVHLVTRETDGSLLLELFSRDGIGTLISTDPFEHIRKASIDDIGGLLELIEPLEEAGILVRRSREKLEMEIGYFTVQERDGMITACAALYPFPKEGMAELACLAVHNAYRGDNRGDALLGFLEREARQLGISEIFVLTTRTAHWFKERGFVVADIDKLPVARRSMYNYRRKSKVFIKHIS